MQDFGSGHCLPLKVKYKTKFWSLLIFKVQVQDFGSGQCLSLKFKCKTLVLVIAYLARQCYGHCLPLKFKCNTLVLVIAYL